MTTAFISGHLDLTVEEFLDHYHKQIIDAVRKGHSFVVGDASGCDTMAQHLLSVYAIDFTCYHMFESPRNFINFEKTKYGSKLIGGFTSDKERDAAMTLNSDYDIAWVREGSRKNCGTALNIKRRDSFQAERLYILRKSQQLIQKPLSEYYTKELLDFRKPLQRDWWDYEDFVRYGRGEYDIVEPSKPTYTMSDLYTELAKRPHIPNKKEAKLLRQQAAKRKK
jgi:hypothetical protein